MKTYLNLKKICGGSIVLFILLWGIRYSVLARENTSLDAIVESKNIQDVYKFIKPQEYNADTLVLFDLDNTLIRPESHLGSDQWFYASVNYFKKQGMSEQKSIDVILPRLFQIMEHSWMKPVESKTVHVIHNLQKKGVTVMALTARSVDLVYRTIEQLAKIGIHFNDTAQVRCPITYGNERPSLYIQGIIFCGDHNKGEVLSHWLDQALYHPKKIIFVDDKMKNIVSVEQALHRRNYPFVGIRYGYLDSYIKTMSPKIIQKEFATFLQQHPESRPIPTVQAAAHKNI